MKEYMKYMTIEERKLFDELAEKYRIKGYTAPTSLTYYRGYSKVRDVLKRERGKKRK